jgi:catechol 2,3-dioxygenase-like lactoylglutathione lyase family enzyme
MAAPKEPAMFKKIDHVEIVTDQLDRSVEFYTKVLGFKLKFRDQVPQPGGGGSLDIVYLDLGGTAVELLSYAKPVEPAPQKIHLGYRMMALEVDDMMKTLGFLKQNGVDPVWGPVFREKYARAEIRDPNGYHIELRQWNR